MFPPYIHIYNDIDQGSTEWLSLRKDKITASQAYTLVTRGKNAAILANQKSFLKPHANNKYAERGHFGETQGKIWINQSLSVTSPNLEVIDVGFIINDNYPDSGFSPDGLLLDKKENKIKALLEFKTFKEDKHIRCCKHIDNVPLDVICQVQFQLMISQLEVCFLCFVNPDCDNTIAPDVVESVDNSPSTTSPNLNAISGDGEPQNPRLKVYEIHPDPIFIDRIKEKLEKY